MTKPGKHHFVPEFHLKRWCHADGRLRRWGRVYDGRLQQDLVSPGATGYRPGLNSLKHVHDSEIERVEREHFGPLDSKASVALQRMIEGQEISSQGKMDFAQYINSLLVRGPSYLEPLKQSAPERLRKLLAQHDEEFNQIKGDRPERTFFEYLQNTSPDRIANAGLTALQLQAREGKVPDLLASFEWAVVRLWPWQKSGLLLADRPVITTTPPSESGAVLALPLTPRHLLLASRSREQILPLLNVDRRTLVTSMNRSSLANAIQFVWGDAALAFIEDHLPASVAVRSN